MDKSKHVYLQHFLLKYSKISDTDNDRDMRFEPLMTRGMVFTL